MRVKLPKHGAVPVALLLESTLTLADLKVYTALSSFQGSNDDAFPSREAIVERCGCALETVSRAVSHLVELGWIQRVRRPNQSSIYRVMMETDEISEVTSTSQPEMTAPSLPKQTGNDRPVTPEMTAPSLPSIKQKDHSKRTPESKHKHGEFQHVLLTDSELSKLKTEYPLDWNERIKRLDEYIEMKGAKYKNHYLTIRNWAQRDLAKSTPLFTQSTTSGLPEDDPIRAALRRKQS